MTDQTKRRVLKPTLTDPPLKLPEGTVLDVETIDRALRGDDGGTTRIMGSHSAGLIGNFDDVDELEREPRR